MPYKSDAQRRFFHSPGAKRAGISKETVKEYDEESKGKDLPERAGDDSHSRSRTTGGGKQKSSQKNSSSRSNRKHDSSSDKK